MSMPQSGPPDPNALGPVSGGPQSPYDQQTPPPPHQTPPPAGPQPGGPPQSFTAPGAGAVKPPVLMIGAIACGVLALLWLLRVVASLMGLETQYGIGPLGSTIVYAVYFLAMALAAGVGAGLALAGNDFGRIFAAAVGGASMWEAAEWWQGIIAGLVTGHGIHVEEYPWFPAIVAALGGFVGIAVVVTMAMPAISTYVAEKRKKPARAPQAGPGMPPPPGGPGMPPPPGGHAGPPPSGPGMAPPPDHGMPPVGGQVYGTPPPAAPGAPPAGPHPGGHPGPPPAGQPPAGPQY